MLNNIRIILVCPTHPGNIGAAARAMKTMGLRNLILVKPKRFPDAQATERAAKAVDIVEQAIVVDSLSQALAGCSLIFGTSARSRALTWPERSLGEAAALTLTEAKDNKIAFVFGREHAGLTNEELELCHYQINIPTDEEYSSLNLAAAVQIVCYEIRLAWLSANQNILTQEWDWASMDEVELFYQHLEQVLLGVNFIKPGLSGQVIPRLRRLFSRSRIEKTELNILRGILTATEKKISS